LSQLSKRFFSLQFGEWYKYVEEMVNIELLPNGNVDDSGNTAGQCPTKLDACMANKIQVNSRKLNFLRVSKFIKTSLISKAVVIDNYWLHDGDGDGDQIDGSIRTTQFLSCVFTHSNWTQDIYAAGKYCADNFLPDDQWNDILLEVESPVGDAVYQIVQKKTQDLKDKLNSTLLERIPWITLDGHHSLRIQNDLLQSVCELFQVFYISIL
jgi:hypothetical protein